MYNAGKIIVGIIIFLVLFTFPFWYSKGKPGPAPKLELPKDAKQCVEATAYMKASHMQLLDSWRDSVVRDGNRIYVSASGKKYNMSLQNTCLKCHKTREKFCDRCHNYVDVTPKCWECHIAPEYKLPKEKVALRSE